MAHYNANVPAVVIENNCDEAYTVEKSRCTRQGFPILITVFTCLSLAVSITTAVIYIQRKPNNTSKGFVHHLQFVKNGIPRPSSRLAYAHKFLFPVYKDHVQHGGSIKLNIEPRFNRVHELSKGVSLIPQGIRIVHTGLYYVYTSVYFLQLDNRKCEDNLYKNFVSRLYRYNHQADETTCLLRTVLSCCPSCRNHEETNFSGGVFRLEKGNVIYVEMDVSPGMVDSGEDVSFLGLLLI